MRIGLVGFATATGLGAVTADFHRHLSFDRWLVVEHSRRPLLAHLLDDRCSIASRVVTNIDLDWWLDGLDAIFSVETSYSPAIWNAAKRRGVAIILMPNPEFFNERDPQWAMVDRFIAGTVHCAEHLQGHGFGRRTEYIMHPLDVRTFSFTLRRACRSFVHYRGWGGYRARKGTRTAMQAARLCPSVPVTLRAQRPYPGSIPENVTALGPVENPVDLYQDGDVALQPSRWEGVGLQILEAQACGMPVLVPDAPPMNEHVTDPLFRIAAAKRSLMLAGRPWPCVEVAAADLAQRMQALLQVDLAGYSIEARKRMERHDWECVGPAYATALGTTLNGYTHKHSP